MYKHHYFRSASLLLILFLCYTNYSFGQINEERKLVIGTWVIEEGSWTFVFGADMKCKEYIEGKLDASYIYKITPANSACGKLAKIADSRDTTISFLELTDIKTNQQTCYEINGILKKTLSLTASGLSQPNLFYRKVKKVAPAKKS